MSEDGETLFNSQCASCHAPQNEREYLHDISNDLLGRIAYWSVVKTIESGRGHEHLLLPAFDNMNRARAEALTKYLYEQKKRFYP